MNDWGYRRTGDGSMAHRWRRIDAFHGFRWVPRCTTKRNDWTHKDNVVFCGEPPAVSHQCEKCRGVENRSADADLRVDL